MASPVVAFLALGLLALRAGAVDLMSAAMRPKFMECPMMNDRLMKCRSALLSTPELSDAHLDPDSDDQQTEYDKCMLLKLGLTMREAMVWCEHKGSLLPVADGLIVKVIDEFQVCFEKGEEPVVAWGKQPSNVSGTREHGYNSKKIYSGDAEDDEDVLPDPYQDDKEDRDYGSDEEGEIKPSTHDNDDLDFDVEDSVMGERHKTRKPFGVDYGKMPASYFYPRKEHGLGNETTTDTSKQKLASKHTTMHPLKKESKSASKP